MLFKQQYSVICNKTCLFSLILSDLLKKNGQVQYINTK